MVVWGTGAPRREFLHVDDLASAVLALLRNDTNSGVFNVGTGKDITIAALARLVCDVIGFDGELRFDATRPDGTPRKVLDVSRLSSLGWSPSIDLRTGIEATYRAFLRDASQNEDKVPMT
jgi:GDP-L-fucose synthase